MLLTALVAISFAAPPAVERLDALDFDNGTILVKESASFGTGVGDWAAWRLSDGSPIGWCSASGKMAEGDFEWELDGAWTLETFVVDTSTAEEESYPGISAKTVQLSVASGAGPWKKLGRFELPKQAKKSFPLPKGTSATRVRVEVLGNHGHGEYTELAELDLLGVREKPSAQRDFTGVYASTFGPLRLEQDGDQVWGCYDFSAATSLLWGTVSGRTVRLTWYEEGEGNAEEGSATFAIAPADDGRPGFWGVWYRGGELAGVWSGVKDTSAAPKCTVRRKGALERQLRKKGHVALYGIRFDVNRDVPRPESEATLQELATVLSANPALAVVIEGHTDATNTDAYNLDLSKRRAEAVLRWLTAHGVKATQLTSKGFGKSRPVADNGTVQGRALNRRVEVALAQ